MKVSVVCAVGWLSSHGYQNVSSTCIGSMAEFADTVYLVQSTRDRRGVDELMHAYQNIIHIADRRTWFSDYEDEHEITFPYFHNRNLAIGMQTAAHDGAECILGMHNNWYIPRRNMAALRARCEATIRNGKPFEWLNRGMQLAHVLFHTSHHVPFIVNPKFPEHIVAGKVGDKARKFMPSANRYKTEDSTMVVDVPLEMTMEDLAAVWDFSFCYNGRVGGSRVFRWETFRPIYHAGIRKKAVSNEPLDSIGEIIARNSRPDFVSHIMLKDFGLEKA